MISKPILIFLICSGTLVIIQSLLPKTLAMQTSSNIDEFMVEDQMSRKRHNYIVQRAKNNMLRSKKNNGVRYGAEYFDLDANPEYLSDFMMDYADMIKNDITLLDNSIETRTRKRGENTQDQANRDPPCSCKSKRITKDFGENTYPRYVDYTNCSDVQQLSCSHPYICKENTYDVYILKRKDSKKESYIELPNDLKHRWIIEKLPVTVGCTCTRDYVQ